MFHKVIVFTNADFKDREVTYMASNNIKSVGKSTDVKVSPILFAKVSVLVLTILSAHGIGIVIGNTFFASIVNKPVCSLEQVISWQNQPA